jgi:SRSO17 transposase
MVEDGRWLGGLRDELRAGLAPVFCQARSRLAAFAYVDALLAEPGDRRSCWQLAEAAGHATPRRMQALLAEHAWDHAAALAGLQRFILARPGDPGAILVLDETAELKKGQMTVGAGRQHAGITGQVENCQTVVNCAYVTARGHALFDFRLYLPKAWCGDGRRRARAQVPAEVTFRTKTQLGTEMVTGAVTAGVPFGWAAGDEVYGRAGKLRQACEDAGKGYVLEVPCDFRVRLHPRRGKIRADAAAWQVPATAWETRSCGPGCKGHRDYAWAWLATASPRHWLLLRRAIADPSDIAFFCCHVPASRPVSLPVLIAVAGKRWPVEECHQQAKGQAGFDQHQVRLWPSFHRHTVLSMCALALLAVASARPHAGPLTPGPAPRAASRPVTAPSPQPGPAPGSSRPARTSRRPKTPAWSRSACPKPAACCAWPPPRSAPQPATSLLHGPAGGENTRPAPAGTTTKPGSGQRLRDHPTDNKPGL